MARILVLDNDRAMRGLLAIAVERGGHEVLQAGTVDEAESALRAAGPADGMLLDLHLGGGHSGVSVVERWRESEWLAPFLVVTGTPEDHSLSRLDGEPRFHGVLAKPFLIEELLQRVEALLEACAQPIQAPPILAEPDPPTAATTWIVPAHFAPYRPQSDESPAPLLARSAEAAAQAELERES